MRELGIERGGVNSFLLTFAPHSKIIFDKFFYFATMTLPRPILVLFNPFFWGLIATIMALFSCTNIVVESYNNDAVFDLMMFGMLGCVALGFWIFTGCCWHFSPGVGECDREQVLEVKLLDNCSRAPEYGTPGSAGLDLFSTQNVLVYPGKWQKVRTGVAINKMPEGTYGRIAPKSGLADKHGLMVNAGVIDADYRGELVVLVGLLPGSEPVEVEIGNKIAQLILTKYTQVDRVVTIQGELGQTVRGSGGFGSTGR